jgi:phage baseplate assembly protein gpV
MRRADVEAATPLCWRRIVPKRGGWHTTCLKPMRYRAQDNTWICPVCGNEDSGLLIAARPTIIEVAA